MSVKYTNFVNVNISHHLSGNLTNVRDTATAIFYTTTAVTDDVKDLGILTKTDAIPADLSAFADYVKSFFANKGKKLHCILTDLVPSTYADSTYTVNTDFIAMIEANVPAEEILVGFVSTDSTITEPYFRPVVTAWNTAHANERGYQKIFVSEIHYDETPGVVQLADYISGNSKVVEIENYVLKFGNLGIGASVLAYYTTIKIYSADSSEDYCYTIETYDETAASRLVFDDNTLVAKAMSLDINIDINIANAVRNIGGNDTKGYSMTNQFMLIVLNQTLEIRLMNLLVTKIKYNSSGLTAVLNVLTDELTKYVNNGFLTTNKTWTDGDLEYNGYRIIDDNTLLNLGFKVVILPFESLSSAEIEANQLPEIFVLVADSYGIRKITLSGEVF